MKLAFILTMPRAGSWNGKWSGEGQLYADVRSFGSGLKAREQVQRILKGQPYSYHWPDGWAAEIEVREVTPREGAKLQKASRGFCGYNWMVDSIICYGDIYADHEKPEGIRKDMAV